MSSEHARRRLQERADPRSRSGAVEERRGRGTDHSRLGHWYNTERLHEYLRYVPPTEFEAAYVADKANHELVGVIEPESPSDPGRFTERAPVTSELSAAGRTNGGSKGSISLNVGLDQDHLAGSFSST